jgi:hypothetical protein
MMTTLGRPAAWELVAKMLRTRAKNRERMRGIPEVVE